MSQTVLSPGSVTFTVVATSGTTMTYQWRKGGTNLSGATASSYTISSVTASDAGDYSVKIVNAGGTVYSSNATLTVLVVVGIATQPQSQTVLLGQNASFSVVASGTAPFTYQWRFNDADLPGATTSSLAITNVQLTNTGGYTVVVANLYGSVTSSVATLTINAAPVLAGANNLPVINQDDANPPGMLVSDLIAGYVSDADAGAVQGIAVTTVVNTNGTWQYSTNSATNWLDFGTPTSLAARLLAADAATRVRFVPAALWNGTVTNGLCFRAWDQTSGTNGGTVNIASSVLDQFDLISFSNNAGMTNWNSAWVETDKNNGGAANGMILVTNGQLRMQANHTDDNIYRQANLIGASLAVLSFNYSNVLGTGDIIQLQVSSNGGSSYTALDTFSRTAHLGTGALSYDISSYIATNTRVRFYVTADSASTFLNLDNVGIAFSDAGGKTAFSTNTAAASIAVRVVAPSITTQPASRGGVLGLDASFSVVAGGSATLSYCWLFNGTPLAGATNSTLTLTNLQSTNGGSYRVVVTNAAGSVTSAVATLTVVKPPLSSSAQLVPTSLTGGGFTFQMSVPADGTYVVWASADLQTWLPISTNVAVLGTIELVDATANGYDHRYYRLAAP